MCGCVDKAFTSGHMLFCYTTHILFKAQQIPCFIHRTNELTCLVTTFVFSKHRPQNSIDSETVALVTAIYTQSQLTRGSHCRITAGKHHAADAEDK